MSRIFVLTFLFLYGHLSFGSLPTNQKIDSLKDLLSKTAGRKQTAGQANILYTLGAHYKTSLSDSAISCYKAGIEIAQNIHDDTLMANGQIELGYIYYLVGNYNASIDNLFKALKVFEDKGLKKNTVRCMQYIGLAYSELGMYEKAMVFSKQSYDLSMEIGDKYSAATAETMIGSIYYNQLNYDQALIYFEKCLQIMEELRNKQGISDAINNVSLIYSQKKEYTKALQYQFRSLALARELNDKKGVSANYYNIGVIYHDKKEYATALKYIDSCIYMSMAANEKNNLKNCYETKADIYAKQNLFEPAFENLMLFSRMKDTLMNEDNRKQFAEMSTKYETERKDDEIKILNKDKELQEQKLKQQETIRNAIIAGLLMLILLFFVVYNQYLHKQKANAALSKTLKELKQTQAQLVQSEKMASLGQLTAGVAHEINNPINFVSGNIKPLQRNIDDIRAVLKAYEARISANHLEDQFKDVLELIKKVDLNYALDECNSLLLGIEGGANRTIDIVRSLHDFAKHDHGFKTAANINSNLDATLQLVSNFLEERNIQVVKHYGSLPQVKCHVGEVNQVFMNIISNAIDAIGKNGTITVSTKQVENCVKISFADTGKGMSREVLKKAFDPFFTTKDVGKGVGLGLSSSFGIIERHNGKLEAFSTLGHGAEFVITLPVA